MPESEFEEYFAELTYKLDALQAQLAASEFGKHFADLKRQIKVLYEAMREKLFPREIAQQWRSNDLRAMTTGELIVAEESP
jgi:hypothetical protein